MTKINETTQSGPARVFIRIGRSHHSHPAGHGDNWRGGRDQDHEMNSRGL